MPAPDPALSLPAKKRAGSSHCLNCGTALQGPFCHYCGQPDRNFMRFFPVLLRDLAEDLLDFDSRFMRTLKPLLFKPGRLTRDYMDGRRYRYAPPMRVYIFSSIVFFLLAALVSSGVLSVGALHQDDPGMTLAAGAATQQQEPQAAAGQRPATDPEAAANAEQHGLIIENLKFNGEPWDRETNPVDIKWLPGWLNDRINDEIAESPKKARRINQNPDLLIDKVFDVLPVTMFVLLPVAALILKFWYLFAGRYYIEHLIFSLHNHSFVFVCLTFMLLSTTADDLLKGYGAAAAVNSWLLTGIGAWMPVYLLVSLRVVYRQSWPLTIGKFIAMASSYLALLSFVSVGVAIASFVLL